MIEPAPGSLVVIQAHPDDADISSGATIAKWAAAGTEITYVTLTSGEAGSSKPELPPEQLGPLREREEEAAATELGVGEVVWLRYPDGRLQANEPVVHRLAAILAERRPAAVMTHVRSPSRRAIRTTGMLVWLHSAP